MSLFALIPVVTLLLAGVTFALLMGVTSERLERDREELLHPTAPEVTAAPAAPTPRTAEAQRT